MFQEGGIPSEGIPTRMPPYAPANAEIGALVHPEFLKKE